LSSGTNGVIVVNAAAVHVENCAIQGFTNAGFCVSGTANSGITTFVKDTVMRNSQINRVDMGKAVFENCRFENDSEGLEVNAKVTLHNCVLAGNPFDGLLCAGGQTMVDNFKSSAMAPVSMDFPVRFECRIQVSLTTRLGYSFFWCHDSIAHLEQRGYQHS